MVREQRLLVMFTKQYKTVILTLKKIKFHTKHFKETEEKYFKNIYVLILVRMCIIVIIFLYNRDLKITSTSLYSVLNLKQQFIILRIYKSIHLFFFSSD